MDFTVVIPARYESSRLPGKPLVDILGKTMIQRVHDQAIKSECRRVIVATDDERVLNEVNRFGGTAVMTARTHESGTDRIEEVAAIQGMAEDEIVVNVQGDEPEIDPEAIDAVIEALIHDPECPMATIAAPLKSQADATNPNIVKVVCDQRGRALYFSRAPIPIQRDSTDTDAPIGLRHIGIYAYRRDFLPTFASWAPTPLELSEKLEQLRVLEHGHPISVAVREMSGEGIDTPEQYTAFVSRYRSSHPT